MQERSWQAQNDRFQLTSRFPLAETGDMIHRLVPFLSALKPTRLGGRGNPAGVQRTWLAPTAKDQDGSDASLTMMGNILYWRGSVADSAGRTNWVSFWPGADSMGGSR